MVSEWAKDITPSAKPTASSLGTTKRWIQSEPRMLKGRSHRYEGIQVWEPLDPFSARDRDSFRNATKNPYVKRALRIQCSLVCGQGYTTKIVPRDEEEVTDDLQYQFENTPIYVPAKNKEYTPNQIKDMIDKMMIGMDLSSNIYNMYYMALQQGRCILAMTPLSKDIETDKWVLPEQFRLIRPEHTMRPVLDEETGELRGVRIIGIRTKKGGDILDADRCVYFTHGFNNQLFSDYYGDPKLADLADIANALNVLFNEDYEQAALHTWFQPPVYLVPIPPQEYGNEENVLQEFLRNVGGSKGQITAVTTSSDPAVRGVEVIPGQASSSSSISSLEPIRLGLIKAIIAHFGIPGFMISEGDVGQLGGNTNISELDNYLNTEITPERKNLEYVINKQIYDNILKILWCVDDVDQVPVKMIHRYNKPRLVTVMPVEMYNVVKDMANSGLIDQSKMREFLGLEELSAEDSVTRGNDVTPSQNTGKSKWEFEWVDKKDEVNV